MLAGETVPERDLAFARQLDALGLTAPVLSRADALAARDAWLAVDARALPVGIAFNRWSEDPDHGDASLADWLPDLPRLASGDQAALFAAHDRYLAGPSDAALVRLLGEVDAVVERSDPGTAGRLFDQKHRSVLVAQHLFRGEVASGSLWGDRPTSAFVPLAMEPGQGPNPVWEVGTFARDEKHGRFELPDAVLARTSGDLRAEMTALRVPWFWAGWTFDQGLQRTHPSNSAKSAEYLLHHLDTDYKTEGYGHGGYRAHAAFAVTKRVLHEQFGPAAQARAYRVALSNFAAYDRAWKWAPTDAERRALYVALTANAYRMLLHLALAEADAGRPVDHEQILRTAGVMETFFEWAQTEHVEADRALVAGVRVRLGGAA